MKAFDLCSSPHLLRGLELLKRQKGSDCGYSCRDEFLCSVAGLSLTVDGGEELGYPGGARSSAKETSEVVRASDHEATLGTFLWRFGAVQLEGDLGVDLELAGGITYLICPGNTSGFFKKSWKMSLGRDARNTLPSLLPLSNNLR